MAVIVRLAAALLLLSAALAAPAAEARQKDGDTLAAAMAAAADVPPDFGPGDIGLTQLTPGRVSARQLAVDLPDVLARASFAVLGVPKATPGATDRAAPWDIGIFVRQETDQPYRVIVDSTGRWYVSGNDGVFASGHSDGFRSGADAITTLDVLVNDDRLELAVNGQFAGSVALPSGSVRGDVAVTTGNFPANSVAGRRVAVTDFQVWNLGSLLEAAVIVGPVAAADEDAFARALALQAETAPLAGPFSGTLEEQAGLIAQSWADVDLADFNASVTFVNPPAGSVEWDYGIAFRSRDGDESRVSLVSSGTWYYASNWDRPIPAKGSATGADLQPGGRNRLDLVVRGDRAWFGINGTCVATFELAGTPTGGNVGATVAAFVEDTAPGRVTAFENFTVWAAPVVRSTPKPAAMPMPMPMPTATATATAAAGALATPRPASNSVVAYIEMTTSKRDGGPVTGEISQELAGTSVFGDTVLDVTGGYVISADFLNPAGPSGTPWDYGFALRRPDGGLIHAVVVDSLGDAYVTDRTGGGAGARSLGPVPQYRPEPGAYNTLWLVVGDGRAQLFVNNWRSEEFDLPEEAGEVQVVAGLFTEDIEVGRTVQFARAGVWVLPD